MKKAALFFSIMFAALSANSQSSLDSIDNHSPMEVGRFALAPCGIIQLEDGNLLTRVELHGMNDAGYLTGKLGYMYYKISRHGADIMDSVYIADPVPGVGLITTDRSKEQLVNPDYPNVLVKSELKYGFTNLSFSYFDDDVCFDEASVTIPLADTFAQVYNGGFVHDSNNDIVLHYASRARGETHFCRFGLDGTQKHHTVHHEPEMAVAWNTMKMEGLRQSNDHPLRYDYWGYHRDGFLVNYLLDSDFGIVSTDTVWPRPGIVPEYNFEWEDAVVSLDDEHFVVMARYNKELVYPNSSWERGITVCKYDREGQILGWQCFGSDHFGNYHRDAVPIDMKRTEDGHIIALYSTTAPMYDRNRISIVKMDEDLNIIWQRFCMDSGEQRGREGYVVELIDNGGIALMGVNHGDYMGYWYPLGFFFLIFDEYGWEVGESCAGIRPYAYWPNPVQGQLSLQYSPDVRPVQAELFDLQGRLVRSQRNALESIDMEGLPAGTYTMRVAMADGKVFSDKVVKE